MVAKSRSLMAQVLLPSLANLVYHSAVPFLIDTAISPLKNLIKSGLFTFSIYFKTGDALFFYAERIKASFRTFI